MSDVTDLLAELVQESAVYLSSWLAPNAVPTFVYRGHLRQDQDGAWAFVTSDPASPFVGVDLGHVDEQFWRVAMHGSVFVERPVLIGEGGQFVQVTAVGPEPETSIVPI